MLKKFRILLSCAGEDMGMAEQHYNEGIIFD
jgi:hypothetical protein